MSPTRPRRIRVSEYVPNNRVQHAVPGCPDCASKPVTFIKGLPLCAVHVEELTQLARRRESRTVGTTTGTLLAALSA